jgi:hypothetical protein
VESGVTNLPPGAYFGLIALLATIRSSPTQIEQQSGVRFERSLDDLGIVDTAVFETSYGIIAGMRCHEEYFEERLDLFVNLTTPYPEGWLALTRNVLQDLNLVDRPEVEVFDSPDD